MKQQNNKLKLKLSILALASICSNQAYSNPWGNVGYNKDSGQFYYVTVREAGQAGNDEYTYHPIFKLSDLTDNTEIAKKADKTYVDAQNVAQDSRLSAIETKNTAQDNRLTAVEEKNKSQDAEIAKKADKTYVDAQNAAQDSRLSAIETKNTTQDNRLDGHDQAIARIDAKDAEQDNRIFANETTIAKGLNFAGDTGKFNRQLGDKVTIKGDKNISTVANGGVINLNLSDNPVFDGVVTVGKGITVLSSAKIDMGGNVIGNVGKGAITSGSKDAVTGGQVFDLASDVAKNFGASVTVTKEGRLTAPSIQVTDVKTGKTITHNNMGSAFEHVNANQVVHTARLDGLDTKTDYTANSVASIIGGDSKALSNGIITAPNIQVTDAKTGQIHTHNDITSALEHVDANQVEHTARLDGLDRKTANLSASLNTTKKQAFAGTASALAVASLPQAWKPEQTGLTLGTAVYRGQTGYALGISRMSSTGRTVLKAALTADSRGGVGASVGAFLSFD
ncbi:YadA-like family protein [Oligella urethralis]|uniref:YadA-like family protein n=1 Tax=Oligella urethralis TaxID=90245 RepID=UPI00035FCAFB|nr:YadA-like family protein [Oligella urethralis]SUA67680.1 YadA-like C-terminal region [Oligella urethralis]